MDRIIKFRRAHFYDEEKTRFSHFSEWGVGINDTVFSSPSQNNKAIFYKDYQFTGLHDKNGKEIYEGDILNAEGGKFIGAVRWSEGFLYWQLSGKGFALGLSTWESKFLEIMGNIHENPEPLNG